MVVFALMPWPALAQQAAVEASAAWVRRAPPDAMMLDASKVNVVLGLDGVQTTLPRVPEGGVCPSTGGWHYDSDATPTQVILCPTSCDTAQEAVRSAGGASVDVQFGCDSLLI